MNQSDLPTLRDRLAELADAVGSRPPGDAGVKAWLMALRDFPMPDVTDAMDQWIRTKSKMAAPADIRLILANRLSDRIERQAVADKAAFAEGAQRILASREVARFHLDKIRGILARSREKGHSPDDWWHKLIERWRAGEQLVWMQMVNAKLAWENSGRPPEWTPPGVDAEWEAERAAIQSEGQP